MTGTTVSSTWANNTLSDIATGLTTALLKDGTQTATALIPFALGLSAATGTLQYPASNVVGAWTTPTFSAGDYTANGTMTWTVASGDVTTNAYSIIDKMMIWSFSIDTTTVGGNLNNSLRIAIPGSKVSTKAMHAAIWLSDNNTAGTGIAVIAASGTYMSILHTDSSNFAAATDTTSVRGFIAFQIN